MSKRANKKQANRVVRDRLAMEKRRQRTLWTTLIAIAALIFAGLIGWAVYQGQQSGDFAVPAHSTDTGGEQSGMVVAGSGPVTVEVYLDFLCPACRQFETTTNAKMNELLA